MFSVKDPVPRGLRAGVVYKFLCAGCSACYGSDLNNKRVKILFPHVEPHLYIYPPLPSTCAIAHHGMSCQANNIAIQTKMFLIK